MSKIAIRKIGFWFFDFLTGSKVKKHYKDIIKKSYEDYDNIKDLTNILEYSIKNVPFYSEIKEAKLELFPVMNKSIFKKYGDKCISNEYKEKKDNLYKASTSGSTGEPLVIYENLDKKNRSRADFIRAHELINWNLGDKFIFIRNWASNYRHSKVKQIAENVIPISIENFDNEKKEWLVKYFCKYKNCVLFGYSSSICDFMNYIRKNNIETDKLHIKLIVCDSDELSNKNKKMLKETFKCDVINRYDNEENGLIAISSPNSDVLHVNNQSVHIELLEVDSDKHVKPGVIGRVVITDLYNKAMPLIRYDTGDYAISKDDSKNVKTIEVIVGRKADSLKSTDGNLISSVSVSAVTEIFYNIEKYQLIQNSKTDFDFIYTGILKEDELKKLESRLKDCLGKDANIKFIHKDQILSSKNGKFKTIVNKMKE